MNILKVNFPELTTRLKAKLNEIITAVNSASTLTGTETLTNKTLTSPTINGGTSTALSVCTPISAAGAIAIEDGVKVITASSAIALTLAAPTTAQNGTIITIMSSTAYAHTITFTGGTLVNGTTGTHTTGTCAAYVGATLRVIAYNGQWYQSGISGVTIS